MFEYRVSFIAYKFQTYIKYTKRFSNFQIYFQNVLVVSGFVPYGVTHSVLLDVGFNHYPILLLQIYENIFTFPNLFVNIFE